MTVLSSEFPSRPAAHQRHSGHRHSATCCGRRGLLTGLAALGADTVLSARKSVAQGAEKPFRIDLQAIECGNAAKMMPKYKT